MPTGLEQHRATPGIPTGILIVHNVWVTSPTCKARTKVVAEDQFSSHSNLDYYLFLLSARNKCVW